MEEDPSSNSPGPTKEVIEKRKRLDARVYKRHWQVSNAKKQKGEEPSPEIKDGKLDTSHTSCEKQRNDDEVKSQPGDVETATLEQSGSSVPKTSEYPTDCKTKLPRYVEYWVPVALSYVQLEKYCETLIKSSMLLCSSLKNEVLDSLHEILTTIRKCCDHPYLVDSTLQKFVIEGRPVGDYLSNGIEVSGKLLLLDKLLEEVKRKHLRVLIVFQSNDSRSQSNNLQHFLDDLICGKVGVECFEHVYREFDSSQKRAAVDRFNDKESGKLVMLIEKSSCQPNIKLSSMDCVILFNSDLSPSNDMKYLRRMSIQSKFDNLKVFRMYSSYSVEEKALNLAKEGTALDCSFKNIGHNACHMLLLWGTSHLFSKVDKFHSQYSSIKDLKCLSEDKLALDVAKEFSGLLSCEYNDSSCLLITKVREADDDYSQNIVLHGEKDEPARDDDLPPFAIWASLLEGRNPMWKLLPGSSERIRRRGGNFLSPAQYVECSNSGAKMMSTKTSHSVDKISNSKPRARKVCQPPPAKGAGKVDGLSNSHGNDVKGISCGDDYCSPSKIEETCARRMRELVLKQKEEVFEFYSTKRKAREKLEEEHQSEVNLMNNRYKEAAVKKEQLKNLDLIYEQKLEEHNRQMDTKRQELEAEHSASRANEKQLKDKLFDLLQTQNLVLIKLSLLETPLGQQTACFFKKSSDPVIMRSNTAFLESDGLLESEGGTTNTIVQRDDLSFSPDQVPTNTEILSVESEGDVSISILREEVCDTTGCDIEAPEDMKDEDDMKDAMNSGTSATIVCLQRIEKVWDDHCNIEDPAGPSYEEDEMRSATDFSTQQMIEELQVGDYNIEDPSGAFTGVAEVTACTSVTLAVQERVEELQDGDCNLKSYIRASNEQAEMRCTGDSGTTSTMVGQQRVEETQSRALVRTSSGKAERRDATNFDFTTTLGVQQRVEEVQSGPVGASNGEADMRDAAHFGTGASVAGQKRVDELHDVACNIEAAVGASNREGGAGDSGVSANVAVHVEELMNFPSSVLNGGNEVILRSQTCSMIGNSSPLELPPVVSLNLPCNEIRPTTGTSGLPNFQASRVLAPCQPGYTQASFRNIELCDQPVVQPQLQSASGQTHPYISSSSTIVNSSYQDSLRYNQTPSACTDPFQYELERIKKRMEELDKIHADEAQNLESAREKEMQEIQNKYSLLLRNSENVLVQKKLEMKFIYRKVQANKFLAETLKSSRKKQVSSSMSQEDLLGAIFQMYPMQFNLSTRRNSVVSTTPSSLLPPQLPVQVQQISELISLE